MESSDSITGCPEKDKPWDERLSSENSSGISAYHNEVRYLEEANDEQVQQAGHPA